MKNKKLIIILGVIICMVSPIIINLVLSLNLVPSIGTSNSDWLGFWGSFLGSIIGGLATLMGVLMTIWKMEEDKEVENRKKLPFLVPLKKYFHITRDLGDDRCYLHDKLDEEDKLNNKFSDLIYFDIINLGEEHAFNVSMSWVPPNLEDILSTFKRFGVENKFEKFFKFQCNNEVEIREEVFQIIKSSEGGNIDKTYLITGLGLLITYVAENIIFQIKKEKKIKRYENIPVGTLLLTCFNIQGKNIEKSYRIELNFSDGLEEKESCYHWANITFNIVDKVKCL